MVNKFLYNIINNKNCIRVVSFLAKQFLDGIETQKVIHFLDFNDYSIFC